MGWDGIVSQFEARLQGLRADRSAASHQADHWVSDAAMGR
jgi:hypothetical protein